MAIETFNAQPGRARLGRCSPGTPPFFVTEGGDAIFPIGIASAEAFGAPTVTQPVQNVAPVGIASAEVFGTPVICDMMVLPAGIASAEAFSRPVVTRGARPSGPPPLRPIRIPGQGPIWFDHIPYSSAEPQELVMTSRIQYPGEQMEINLGASGTVFGMGGPQCCGFIVPEYLGADLGIVAYGAVGMGGPRNVLYCR